MTVDALDSFLLPLKQIFDRDGVNEISINRPFEAWVEIKGDMYREELPNFDVKKALESFGITQEGFQNINGNYLMKIIYQNFKKKYYKKLKLVQSHFLKE